VCVVVPEVSDLAGCIVDEVGENPADFDEAERRSDFVDFFLETISLLEAWTDYSFQLQILKKLLNRLFKAKSAS